MAFATLVLVVLGVVATLGPTVWTLALLALAIVTVVSSVYGFRFGRRLFRDE
jgi:membrane protein implicated in regulation of membrane protease activity